MRPIPKKLQSVLNSLSEQAAQLLNADDVSIWLRHGDRIYLAADTSGVPEGTGHKEYHLDVGNGLTGWVVQKATPVRFDDLVEEANPVWKGQFDFETWPERIRRDAPKALMAVPIVDENSTIGVCRVLSRTSSSRAAFTEADQKLLETISGLVTTALRAEPEFLDAESGPYLFVLMPFASDFVDIYKLGIKSVATKLGMRCERVDEIEFNDVILAQIYDGIQRADLVIAEMTGRNPNVFYEVGYAHALSKTVVLITQKAEDIPFDLAGHNHIIYEGSITTLQERLEKRLRSFLDSLRKTTAPKLIIDEGR